jgi:hypothetical protein
VTRLENRLRQELQDIAQRVAPGDLRPLREPASLARPQRLRVLAPVAAMVAVGLVIGGLVLTRNSMRSAPAQTPTGGRSVPLDPSEFAIFGTSRTGSAEWIKVASLIGRGVRLLAPIGTSNSLALSPDSKSVFVVNQYRSQIAIQRISVATSRVTFVADGANPAVSPDSRYLAYATGNGFSELAVRDLRTGSTRTIDVAPLIGGSSSFLTEPAITWLGDGTQVVVVPRPDLTAQVGSLGGDTRSNSPAGTACGQQDSPRGLCVIVMDTGARRLRVRPAYVPVSSSAQLVVGADSANGHGLLIAARNGPGVRSLVAVSLAVGHVLTHRIATLPPKSLVWSIAPAGDRILYSGNTPAGIWTASWRGGRLVHQHRLVLPAKFSFDEAAW